MKRHILFYSLLLLALLCPAALKAKDFVIINQVMYDTPLSEESGKPGAYNGEFFELYNGGKNDVDLSNWSIHSLSGAKQREVYWFPDRTIPAGGYMIFASCQGKSNTFKMEDLYASITQSVGRRISYYSENFVLSNKKETLLLIDAHADTVDQVVFGTETPLKAGNWNGRAGDDCLSLHRTGLKLDENGKIVIAKNQWKSDKVSFEKCQLPDPMFGVNTIINSESLSSDNNYILSVSPLDAIADLQMSETGMSVDANIRTQATIQYYDGLGRPTEKIALGITPSKKDLVSTTTYNGLRRVTQEWIPIPMDSKGQFMSIASAQDQAETYFDDARPFTETLYESSALDRVIGKKQPGVSYSSHPSSYTYSIESSNNVRIFTVAGNKLKMDGIYMEYTLFKTTIEDEDGKGSLTTYTDKLGRKIMEERILNHSEYMLYRTYFVYDDLGRLRFVLPHMDPSKLIHGKEYDLSSPILCKGAYCYQYDERGNMIYKRLPGCEPIYMVYDMMGQLVLKQDGNQRKKNKWTQFAYDSIGRNLYSCEIYTTYDEYDLKKIYADKWAVEHFDGKTNQFPITNTGYANTILDVVGRMYTVNYYDNYDYLDMKKLSGAKDGLQYDDGEPDYGKKTNNTTGLLTGTRVYNLSEPGFIVTAYYYDAQGRVIQSRSMRGSADIGFEPDKTVYTKYKFDGSVSKQLTKQGNVKEYYHYVYDHAGRTKEVWYKLNNDREIKLSEFSYDEIGHLAQNLLHNGKDEIEYLYDMRNMLSMTYNKHFSEELYYADQIDDVPYAKPCHNGNIAAVSYLQGDSTYTFAYEYDNMNRLTESKYKFKGKVQTSEWFKYDARGNILQLQRHSGPRLIDDLRMTYQEDGNQLLSVSDDGNGGDMYGMIDYEDGHNADGDNFADMRYDVNGNLLTDKDRGIRVRYNILNLPDTIQFGYGGHQIVNHYDANGRKYKSIIYTNVDPGMSYYDDIAHYTFDMDSVWWKVTEYNGNIETYYTPEDTTYRVYNSIGYYDSKTNAYYHYIKDHLGNISAVVNSQADTMIQSTIYYASGVPMMESKGITEKYYMAKGAQPNQNFGRDEQPYLYNGKEFVEAHGLNESDLGNRCLHHTISRFTTMDRFAEKCPWQSPYAFAGNNSVNYIDVNGDSTWIVQGSTYILLQDGKLYNSNGSSYEGKTTLSTRNKMKAIEDISETEEGKALITELQNSTNNFYIRSGLKNEFKAFNVTKAAANLSEIREVNPYASSNGSGGDIYWDSYSTSGGLNEDGDTYSPAYIGLAHELIHARDANKGKLYPKDEKYGKYIPRYNGILKCEWRAVYYENIIRSQAGLPLRTYYGYSIDGSTYFGVGVKMLSPDGKPINYPRL